MIKPLLFVLFGLAVMDCQPEPTVPPEPLTVVRQDSLITLKLIKSTNPALPLLTDSLLTVNLPKFDLVATQSTTPDGKLERIDHVSENTTYSVNYLYNELGQPAGYSSPAFKSAPAPERGRQVTYYEYKDDRPYRIFTKVYEPEIVNDFVYFMDEFRYTSNKIITVWSYALYLKKQQAALTTITVNTYDGKGHLVQSLEPGAGTVYQTFTWDKDNLMSRQDFYADGNPLDHSTEYTYDDKPNPLQGLELRYGYELASANNITSETLTETDVRSKNKTAHKKDYQPTYDNKGRLSSKTTPSAGQQKGEKSLFIYK